MKNKLTKDFYNTILSQALSPCGHYLVAGDIYGYLSIFNISKLLNSDGNTPKEDLRPRNKIMVKSGFQINNLVATQQHLLVGSHGEIFVYAWKGLKGTNSAIHPLRSIPICSQDDFMKAEINSLLYDEETGNVFAGCGDDNNIYIFNLESDKNQKVLQGHTHFIHGICRNDNTLISCGQDGLVNIWDLRTSKITSYIEPHTNSKIARTKLGKWIGAVDFNDDYIVCGGGPRLAMYHFRFLSNSTIFPIDDQGIHVAQIYDNSKVFAGGRSKYFYQASFNGDIIAEIPTSGPTTYSAIRQEHPFQIMCIAGSSSKIDVSRNFLYRDQQLSLY